MRKFVLATCALVLGAAASLPAQGPDPRVGLKAGLFDAGSAISNMELVSNTKRPDAFVDPKELGNILFANSDMAFASNTMVMGSFHGFQIYDISNPVTPVLKKAFVCPGGQGDVSVHGNLLFMSVEMPNGRV